MTPTRDHAIRILELLSYGLVQGLGEPIPGKMCVEAAVCCALGLPHNDNPPCVGEEVRKFKIGLNDKYWSTPAARATGMRELAIAQLGSDTLDQKKFKNTLWFKLGTEIQPLIWRFLAMKGYQKEERLKLADQMENSKTLKECKAHAHAYGYAYGYAHSYTDAYTHSYTHGYGYGYGYDYGYGTDNWLTKVASYGVAVLKQLNSPGCQWLDLIK